MCNSLIELIISSIPLKSALWLQFIVSETHIFSLFFFFNITFYFNKKIDVFISYNILMDMAMF